MKFVDNLPRKVREIAHQWIPLRTGERLAARLWLPEGAEEAPVPAIVEYIPYRRRDYSAVRDHTTHAYLAGHGYACLRIDVRGSGDSDGIHTEQWSDQYDRDAIDAFEWIAAQPWCDGGIGMIGLSWGGNTGLRMASLAPPQLKAVIAISASDDRYTNKYAGGCLLLNSVVWAYTMMAQNSRPPDPETAGDGWRETWLKRLNDAAHYTENWVGHQRHDAYWSSGSVVERFGEFGCPVYIVGGFADPGYAVTVPRLLQELEVPVKGLLGAWSHKFPHYAMPGPSIGFLQEALRWFDRWLKDEPNGIEDEPALRAFMHEFMPPAGYIPEKRGRWVEEPTWPSPDIETLSLALNPGRLADRAEPETTIPICTPQSVGLTAGEWMPWLAFGEQAELPRDQREDDGRSVCFDSEPLAERSEILGQPVAHLEVGADKPVAMLAVRLCDVAPDGTSVRICYGTLNLTRRNGLAEPEPLAPGQRYRIELPLYLAGHAIEAGHRLRVAISTGYWPVVWPSPEAATVTLYSGASRIDLPVRPPRAEDAALRPFGPVEAAPPMATTRLTEPSVSRTISRDAITEDVTLTHIDDGGTYRIDAHGIEIGARTERHLTIRDDDPTTARVDVDWRWQLGRGDWRVRTVTKGKVWCTAEHFEVEASLEAFEGEERVFEKNWRQRIPRDLL